jgi:hypothetical protein
MDPTNPDHLWFFTPSSLTRALEDAGFVIDELAWKQHVPQENFIYCLAQNARLT